MRADDRRSAASSPRSADLVLAIARHGLVPGAPPWPEAAPSTSEWQELHHILKVERLVGFAVSAVDAGLPLTQPQVDQLYESHARALAACLRLDSFLLEVADILGREGIEPRVLKGPSLARLVYREPAERLYGDIDLLISSDDWDRTIATLRRPGFHQVYGEPRPGWARRFSKGTVVKTDAGWELDLHRTFVRGPFGLAVVLEDVFADPVTINVGGRPLKALPPTTSFLHACYNAALADVPPRLVPVRDVAQHLLSGLVDPEAVLSLAARWRAEMVVARAVNLVGDRLGLEDLPLQSWARSHRAGWWDRVSMLGYTGPREITSRDTVLSLLALRGVRDRVDYVWPLLFPEPSYFAGRHAGRLARFRHALRGLREHR